MTKIKLSGIDTGAPEKVNKEQIKAEFLKLLQKIEELQNLMFAECKHALLVVIQGIDGSGKDGAVKSVFTSVNPMGCRVVAFKQPTETEMKHDFLWRIHHETPAHGMIGVFNRSHYEDVLVQRVHHWVSDDVIEQRYEDINNFEKLLTRNSTAVLKFYLHVSPEVQLKRLQARMSDKTKMWKYNENDIKERQFWNDYMKAYQNVFEHCSEYAPWHIIPADNNWYKEYLIAQKVVDTLEGFKMKFPGLKAGN